MKYLVVVEKAGDGYEAFAPDLPWRIIVRDTREEALSAMERAIKLHVDGACLDGDPPPSPTATAKVIEVDV